MTEAGAVMMMGIICIGLAIFARQEQMRYYRMKDILEAEIARLRRINHEQSNALREREFDADDAFAAWWNDE